jgi:hypothetical protein
MDPQPKPKSKSGKTAIVAYRRVLYQVSPTGLQAVMELTRGPIDRDAAIGFVLRQEGYDISPAPYGKAQTTNS